MASQNKWEQGHRHNRRILDPEDCNLSTRKTELRRYEEGLSEDEYDKCVTCNVWFVTDEGEYVDGQSFLCYPCIDDDEEEEIQDG